MSVIPDQCIDANAEQLAQQKQALHIGVRAIGLPVADGVPRHEDRLRELALGHPQALAMLSDAPCEFHAAPSHSGGIGPRLRYHLLAWAEARQSKNALPNVLGRALSWCVVSLMPGSPSCRRVRQHAARRLRHPDDTGRLPADKRCSPRRLNTRESHRPQLDASPAPG